MPSISSLRQEELSIIEEIEDIITQYHLIKRSLSAIEDSLVENKEKLIKVKELIRLYDIANDFKSLIDQGRESELVGLKERLMNIEDPYERKEEEIREVRR